MRPSDTSMHRSNDIMAGLDNDLLTIRVKYLSKPIVHGPDRPLVHQPHNYTYLNILERLWRLEYGINR